MACGAESNRFQFRYIEEVTPGVAPATGDMKIMRTSGVGGGVTKSGTQSEEIRDDRQVVDRIMTKKEAVKDVSGELSFNTWDDWIEVALFSDWQFKPYRSNDVEVLAGDIYELPTGHGLAFEVGQLIRVAGFTTAANNGDKEITAFSGDQITVAETLTIEAPGDTVTIEIIGYRSDDVEVLAGDIYELPTGHGLTFIPGQSVEWSGFTETANNGVKTVSAFSGDQITVEETLTVEAAGDTVTAKYNAVANGVVKHTYTVEDDFTDVSKVRTQTGMVAGTFAVSMPKEAKIGVTLNLTGQNTEVDDTSAVTGTPIEPNSNDVMNTGDHVAEIKENGVLQSLVEELSFTIDNSLRGIGAVGNIENICVASGDCVVTGDLNLYFEDWTVYQKFLDNSASSLRFRIGDSNGSYHVNIPRIKFTEEDTNAGGPNQDIMANGSFQGLRDSATDKTIIVTRITI